MAEAYGAEDELILPLENSAENPTLLVPPPAGSFFIYHLRLHIINPEIV